MTAALCEGDDSGVSVSVGACMTVARTKGVIEVDRTFVVDDDSGCGDARKSESMRDGGACEADWRRGAAGMRDGNAAYPFQVERGAISA